MRSTSIIVLSLLALCGCANPANAPEAARQVVQDLRSELARLQQIIHLKDEVIRLLNLRIFDAQNVLDAAIHPTALIT